jgi:hypothetical protein
MGAIAGANWQIISEASARGQLPLLLSKRQLRQVERIQAAREQQHSTAPSLLFGPRPLILCGMPVKKPPISQLIHRRRNGHFLLEICAHPKYGLPFGQDRLVLIWVASLAVKQQSRIIAFKSGAQILREFDLPLDGRHYSRMIEAFGRIFSSTIYFGIPRGQHDAIECSRAHFFDALDSWFSPQTTEIGAHHENVVVLSEAFWEELRAHPIPVCKQVVCALASSPACLDLYLWLVWRSFGLRQTQRIPVGGSSGLSAQLGSVEYDRSRDFERTLTRWVKRIRTVWPECPAHVEKSGRSLIIWKSSDQKGARTGSEQ